MSFFASNNRIRVLDDTDTVFDTENNMPHIVGTAYVTNVGVTFSNIPSQEVFYFYLESCAYNFPSCAYNLPSCVFTPGVCPPTPFFFCPAGQFCLPPLPPPCSFPVQTCTPVAPTCTAVPPFCFSIPQYAPQYIAREVSGDQVVVDLPVDEDGNPISIDFVVIQANGSRTVNGQDNRMQQSFLSAVPPETFSFQGSMILESSLRDDGSSWFKRIISLFINNTTKKLVLRKQETVGARNVTDPEKLTNGYPTKYSTGNESSTFNFNFKVFFGRFKS